MQYRTVPKNGDQLSVLGYGCMRLPGKRQGIDKVAATRQIYSAIDRGVNYIDTAYTYHMGKSEPFLGNILSRNGYRYRIKLATKLPHWSAKSKEDMDRILAEQCAKLKTDYIDYYLIHALAGESWDKAKRKGVISFLDDALASGRILNAGFSYHGASEDFKTVINDYDWTFCQIQYNYLDTANQAGTAGLQYAASKNMAVMVMEPLRGGNLAKTPPGEIQTLWSTYEQNWTPTEWAFRWLYNHPEVTVVLSGMNDDDHIIENIRIASESEANMFTEEETALVNEVSETYRRIMRVGCTGCQYCMPCPAGVNIPACFETYNSYRMFGDNHAKLLYLLVCGGVNVSSPALASQCIECGKCLEKCPQHLNIPEHLKEVRREFEGIMTKPMLWFAKKAMKVKS